jgi:hypothetical protein
MLKKGLIRRIGDGETTRIWNHRWLLYHFAGCPLNQGQNVEVVADLMTDSRAWNEELIKDSFFPVDVAAILKQPLTGRGEDFWAWEMEKHGNYSVRSAYRLHERVWGQQDRSLPGTGPSVDGHWQDVPPKVKNFWWRVLHDYLPAKQVLHRRHIEPIAYYDTCGAEEESARHVLTERTVARIFWERTEEFTGVKLPSLHPLSWASDLLLDKVCSKRERSVIICGMWSLWMLRNQRRHGQAGMSIRQVVFLDKRPKARLYLKSKEY